MQLTVVSVTGVCHATDCLAIEVSGAWRPSRRSHKHLALGARAEEAEVDVQRQRAQAAQLRHHARVRERCAVRPQLQVLQGGSAS